MIRIKKNSWEIDHLDETAYRWLNSEHGESAIKNDIEKQWNAFLATAETKINDRYLYRRRGRHRLRWIAAASAAILLAAGGLWHYGGRNESRGRNTPISRISEDIRLILSDGEQILLDSRTEDGIITQHGSVSMISKNGTLIHEKQVSSIDPESELQWSTLVVPRGNQFDLILEDGTHVWLNAGSCMRFPVAFGDDERRVHMEGEAYFAVAHDMERPFIVETPRQDITVYGTEFNVYAYLDEPDERTTLMEGGVTLWSRNYGPVTLAPGQQAVLQVDKYIVREIDAQSSATWRNGVFVLDGITFGEVFLKLSRWYDFTYSFEDKDIAQLTFSGNLRRHDDANVIFEIIETIAKVNIDADGNRIRISKRLF